MGEISKAAFQVDDYWRIVEIVHHRLIHYDEGSWRVSYKTLLLLEHLLTHGPLRVAQEFERRRPVIRKMGSSFAFYKEKGFNWGLSVRNLSRRVVKLLEDGQFLIEERNRRLKLTRGIQGFGNFNNEEPSTSSSSSSDSDDDSLTLFSTGTQSPDSTGGFTLTETSFNSNYECSENQIHSYLQLPMEDDEIEDSPIECHHLVFSSDNSTTISLSSP
ncbi:Clathrin interactor 1 [Linum grandiflorum]